MRSRLEAGPNHYHAGGVDADDHETEVQIVGRAFTNNVSDLIVLTPEQAATLGEWLAADQLAIRDQRIEELELELELQTIRDRDPSGPAWDYGPGQPYHIPPEGDA